MSNSYEQANTTLKTAILAELTAFALTAMDMPEDIQSLFDSTVTTTRVNKLRMSLASTHPAAAYHGHPEVQAIIFGEESILLDLMLSGIDCGMPGPLTPEEDEGILNHKLPETVTDNCLNNVTEVQTTVISV